MKVVIFVKSFFMSAILIRKELHEMIDIADDRLVSALYVMVQSLIQNDDSVVANTTLGEPLTRDAFIARVREAYDSGKRGDVKTEKEL